jgi:hypothetical protein
MMMMSFRSCSVNPNVRAVNLHTAHGLVTVVVDHIADFALAVDAERKHVAELDALFVGRFSQLSFCFSTL